MLIKIKSYLSMTSSCSAAGAIILGLLSSAVLTNVAYAQIFPNTQDNSTATPPSPPSTLQQPTQPKLHLVKITSPDKGQQVPVGKDLTIFGTSLNNITNSDCKVSVKVNGINPYHDASGNGGPGETEYSKWNFTLTSAYTNIQPGPNKITAKFSCGSNPILLSHNSVNVTGVAATDVAATNNNSSQQEQISSTATPPIATEGFDSATANSTIAATSPISSGANFSTNVNNNNYDNNIKPLSVSVHLGKNSLHPGDKQTITLSVADKNSTDAVGGASVSGKITGPSGPLKKVEGTTDDNGKASYSWKVSDRYTTGKYKLKIEVSAPGYENYSGSKTFKVTPIPVTVSNDNSITSNSDSSSTLPTIPDDNVIRSASPVTIPDNTASTSDNTDSHHHKHHIHSSNIISSASPVSIPTGHVFPSNSDNTNTNMDTDTNGNNEHHNHPSTIIPSTSDNTETNTTPNNDQHSSSIGGDINSNSLSSSLESNVGKNVGGLAQKIINDVKNKLEMQGIHLP
ncbi:MAG: hypothetical protein M3P08_06175 [Thermoproteota archaeon]|nr:hypothetical protein [Thermoproteota archaeon]